MTQMSRNGYAIFILLLLLGTTHAAKILVLHVFPARSHIGAYQPLYEELARKGHEVSMVTFFPRKEPLANFHEIILKDPHPPSDKNNFFEMGRIPWPILIIFFSRGFTDQCEKILQDPKMQELIKSTDLQFDLIIYEPFMVQCVYGFIHKFKAPTIQVLPNTLIPWNANSVGNPSTLSYIPNLLCENEDMSFLSRMSNFALAIYMKYFNEIIIEPQMETIMRKYFPDPTLPTISELEKRTSLLFLHSHPILNHPRPLTPNTIEVGGLHITGSQSLPEDLKKFLDNAPNGVIYFSLGSNIKSKDMPDTMRNSLLNTFSKLKQNVLWKWEDDTLPGQPKNVKLGKWLPQHAILAHPNVKLFITHGGLMSLQEVTYFGVPLIAVPIGLDQNFNADVAKNRGFGVVVDVKNITEESFSWAIREVLENPRYRNAIRRASRIIKDQPQTPLERAVYWVEYAIRHEGAPHLRSASLDLNDFQYHLLDVIAVLFLIVLLTMTLTVIVVRRIIKYLCSKSSKNVSTKKKTN